MKGINFKSLTRLISILVLSFLVSCGTIRISEDLIGTWESELTPTTVRIKENGKYQFIKGEALYSFTIHPDKSVSGQIGNATFNDGFITTNWLLPTRITGVSLGIDFDLEGKIFASDPLEQKVTELWMGPIQDGQVEAELRYTKGMQQFPMAHIKFRKLSE